MRVDAGVAVAPTPGAAWALASFGDCGTIVPPDDVAAALAPLAVAALRLSEELREALHHLGIETIGQLVALPRGALPARFGPTLLLRLDQAFGRATEPLVPLPWHAPITSRMDFEGPIDSWETIWLVFKQLIERVLVDLTRRGCGARRVEVEFHRADKRVVRHAIALSRPSRDAKNLFNLIRCATENVDGGDDGFMSVRLHVPLAERLDPEQIALLGGERYAAEIEFAQLAERLSVRLGEEALARPVLVESHVPERAFSCHGFSTRDSFSQTKTPLKTRATKDRSNCCPIPSRSTRWSRRRRTATGGRCFSASGARCTTSVTPSVPSGSAANGGAATTRRATTSTWRTKTAGGSGCFRVNETNRWYVHGFFT
jgi:protein ImuB